jgi:hypothetical protein
MRGHVHCYSFHRRRRFYEDLGFAVSKRDLRFEEVFTSHSPLPRDRPEIIRDSVLLNLDTLSRQDEDWFDEAVDVGILCGELPNGSVF